VSSSFDGAHPYTDRRRLAPALTPGWAPTGGRDDFGSALLEAAARLAEQTTQRLDRTAARDALAFFDFLGLPPVPPRAATGVLVLTLAGNHPHAVTAGPRTQITAGDDVTFETVRGLRAVPGRLASLVVVDPAADRIEPGPALACSAQPPPVRPQAYQVVTFAGAGSTTVQLSPEAGLAAGDLLRIAGQVHRVAGSDSGLVTLDDPLPAATPPGAEAVRVDAFATFTLRDRQRHAFYLGHAELLKLEQPAIVTVGLTPAGLSRDLTGRDLTWAMFGTRRDETDPAWHKLDPVSADAGEVALSKSWAGTVDETEVAGRKSRWLRAVLNERVSGPSSASRISLAVASSGSQPPSGTIVRAAHNGTPLSTRRFYPFGPEPLRFDVFALAAPEALSKKGATVTLDVTLADASLTSFELTPGRTPESGYGAGGRGDLHMLSREPGGGFRWQQLSTVVAGKPLRLGGPPAGVALPDQDADLVVIRDDKGGLWAARVQGPSGPAAVDSSGWQTLPKLEGAAPRPVVVPTRPGVILLDVLGGVLTALPVDDLGRPAPTEWQPVAGPDFTDAWQLVPVQNAGWPRAQVEGGLDVVAIDKDGRLWHGAGPAEAPLSLVWSPIETGERRAAHDVRVAATRYGTKLWVAYARPEGDERHLHGVIRDGDKHVQATAGTTVEAGTALHSNPAVLGAGDHPVTIGRRSAGEILLWHGATHTVTIPLAGVASTGRPLLLGDAEKPELVVPATGERVLRTPLAVHKVAYTLHNGLEVSQSEAAYQAELATPPSEPDASRMIRLKNAVRITEDERCVCQIDGPLPDGMTVRLLRPAARAFTGGMTPGGSRKRLKLDPKDKTTSKGHRLIIGDASYLVDLVQRDRVARLTTAVIGGEDAPKYTPATVLRETPVTDADRQTLVQLNTPAVIGPPAVLGFDPPANPQRQEIRLQQQADDVLWARLSRAWTEPPPGQGRVTVNDDAERRQWDVDSFRRGYQNPEVSWEFFDGRGWRVIEGLDDHTRHLSATGTVTFTVPRELRTTEIGGQQDYWIRARLIGGDYGRPRYHVEQFPTGDTGTTQSVTVDTSDLHPPEILAIEASFTLDRANPPEIVLVENNLDVRDETGAATSDAARFDLFTGASALGDGRALYAGLTASPGIGPVTLFADTDDQDGDTPLLAELCTPDGWRRLPVDDRTRALRRRGLITVTVDVAPTPVRLFGQERVWLRLWPDGDAASWAPVVHRLLLNAAPITHARTMPNEIVGSSLGQPALTLRLAEAPVLPDSVELRVREDLGEEEQAGLPRRDGQPAVRTDPRRFPGAWVLWQRADSLTGHDGDARVYLLDPATGQVRFGDGRTGKIPPAGRDNIRCFHYQQGGGADGNLPAWSPVRLVSAVEGADAVALPAGTAGGFSAPAGASLLATAPDRLRHAGRALTSADVESIAVASSSEIVRARCARPDRPGDPIRVTVAVRGRERCPQPTLAQREAVAAAVREAGWGGLTEDSVRVSGPLWVPATVTAHLATPVDRIAEVDEHARAAVLAFLDPVTGGPDGGGWPFGRQPTRSDLLRTLSRVPGVDRVHDVEITPSGPLPADALICTDTDRVKVVVTAVEGPP
jgi:hypothetical protein